MLSSAPPSSSFFVVACSALQERWSPLFFFFFTENQTYKLYLFNNNFAVCFIFIDIVHLAKVT